MSVKRPEFPVLADIATLRTQTSTGLLEDRVFLTNTSGSDEVSSYWYVIDGSYDGTYDDGAMHVVDASSRIWAREYTQILPSYFGMFPYTTYELAEDGTDYSVHIQKFIDYWMDPTGFTRSNIDRKGVTVPVGGWNQFLGFSERPLSDQGARPAYVPTGHYGYSDFFYVDCKNGSVTEAAMFGKFKAADLTMEGWFVLHANAPGPGCRIRCVTNFLYLDGEVSLRVMRALNRDGATRTLVWGDRTFTTNAATSKYPNIPFSNYTAARNWYEGMTATIGDLVSYTLSDGKEQVYEATSTHVALAPPPTHTSGTDGTNFDYVSDHHRNYCRNLVPAMGTVYEGEYLTYTEPSGSASPGVEHLYKVTAQHTSPANPTHFNGSTTANLEHMGSYVTIDGHGWEQIAAADNDAAYIVETLNHNYSKPFTLDSRAFCYGIMLRPSDVELEGETSGTINLASIKQPILYEAKIGFAVVEKTVPSRVIGYANSIRVQHSTFRTHISTTAVKHPTDETQVALMYVFDRAATGGIYGNNDNEHTNINLESGIHTAPAKIIQICLLGGCENNRFQARVDSGNYYGVWLGADYDSRNDPFGCTFRTTRSGETFAPRSHAHTWLNQYSSTSAKHIPQIPSQIFEFDFANHSQSGVGDPASDVRRIYFKDLWYKVLNTTAFTAGVTQDNNTKSVAYHPSTDGWYQQANHGVMAIFDIDWVDVPEFLVFKVMVWNKSGTGARPHITLFEPDGQTSLEQFKWSCLYQGTSTFRYTPLFPSVNSIQSSTHACVGTLDVKVPVSFAVPRLAKRVGIRFSHGVTTNRSSGFTVEAIGYPRVRLLTHDAFNKALNTPDYGVYKKGHTIHLMDGRQAVLTGSSQAIGDMENNYIATRGALTTIAYYRNDFVTHDGKIYQCGTAGTYAGDIGGANLLNWVEVGSSDAFAVGPSDWTILYPSGYTS